MPTLKYHCPFCSQEVSYNHYGEHILKKHEEEIFSKKLFHNTTRLHKYNTQPVLLKLEDKLATDHQYYCCLGCLTACKKQASTQNHFPKCLEAHKKKCKELYDKYCPSEVKEQSAPVIVQTVVQGWTDEQVNALLGAMLSTVNKNKLSEEDYRRKANYYEEAIRDLPEEYRDEIEEEVPEYPDDDEIEVDKASDVIDLFNLAAKIGFHIDDAAIPEAYKKMSKMPPKKLKKV